MSFPKFELWRLMGTLTCFALALGFFRFAVLEVRAFGGGILPTLCFIIAISLAVDGAGLLFRRVGEFLLRFWGEVLSFLIPW